MTDQMSDVAIPKGKYTLIGVDVDTTGRRLIDEIVQLAAYSPTSQYSEYIMPIMNLNPAARQRHQIRVITVGFFRMLKSMQTYKVVKTKTEFAALLDFLDWLEQLHKSDPGSQGCVLIYHEQRKFIPYMILEAMKKYDLLGRFLETVKSFADGFSLAESKCGSTIKYFNLKQLAKVLLKQEEVTEKEKYQFEGNASVRARLAYEVLEHLAKDNQTDLTADEVVGNMLKMTYDYSYSLAAEFKALEKQKQCLIRQNSLRPIFVNYFKVTLYHRVKAVTFRRVLAENCYDLNSLQELWNTKKKEGVDEAIATIEEIKAEDKTELAELLDCYFDPEKQAIKPVVKSKNGSRRNGQKENMKPRENSSNNTGGSSDDNQKSQPDSTIKTPTKKSNSRRRRSSNNNQNKQMQQQIQQQIPALV